MGTALLVVDVQNDFVEGGALAVAGGKGIIAIINKVAAELKDALVIASQDWHPLDHCSFDKNGGIWPVHCVADSKGAELVADLVLPENSAIVRKGADPKVEAYSPFDGFEITTGKSLKQILDDRNIDHIYICGIALNFCVRAAVLDALKLGYKVTLIENATVGVPNVDPTPEATLSEIVTASVQMMKAY